MPKAQLEEGQIVQCTVTKIVGTIVFAKIEEYNSEGTITFAEIFPGKIRNIRDFVFPGKKIVCKVLRINPHVIDLSLRRVKVNERNEFNESFKKEKSYLAMFRTLLGEEQSIKISRKIKEEEKSLVEFLERAKEDIKLLEKYLTKEQADKIISILKEKKAKETMISKKFSLSSKSSNGIVSVRNIIKEAGKEVSQDLLEVSYIAAGKYLIRIKTKDPRRADQQLRKMLEQLETLSKKQGCVFNEEKS
jgi:translation initiation factor 2 alpha subunit (eIF-2alpha)